jgi:hypothetical protein
MDYRLNIRQRGIIMSLFTAIIHRRKHYRSYLLGISISAAMLFILALPNKAHLHAHGPLNTGHEKLKCEFCHQPAMGTLRQQLHANTIYFLGIRKTPVEIGFRSVTNSVCLKCHARATDNHPIYRFTEPKYQKVRQMIHPQICVSCHREHADARVTVNETFCKHCHEKIKIKNDPVKETHIDLAKQNRWETCLGCHDFHGNHKMKIATKFTDAYPVNTIKKYFKGTVSLYSKDKKYVAKETL